MNDAIPLIKKARLRDLPDFHLPASAAALYLGISIRRLYRLVDAKELLPSGWVDGEMRFRYSALEDYVINGLPRSIRHLRQTPGTKVPRPSAEISSRLRSISTAESTR